MLTEPNTELLTQMKEISQELMAKISYSVLQMRVEDHYYISFNGGKDCLAAYIILKYFLYCNLNRKDSSLKESFDSFIKDIASVPCDNITFIYFINDKHFECEEDYFIQFAKKEKVNVLYCYSGFICGLNFLIKQHNIASIIMGTRKDDMQSPADANQIAMTLTQPSTLPFPKFMRIFPIFNFTYSEIWRVILASGLDYLSLYDKGYSSIGTKDNTKINPFLYGNDRKIYPAWCLKEEESERQFR